MTTSARQDSKLVAGVVGFHTVCLSVNFAGTLVLSPSLNGKGATCMLKRGR